MYQLPQNSRLGNKKIWRTAFIERVLIRTKEAQTGKRQKPLSSIARLIGKGNRQLRFLTKNRKDGKYDLIALREEEVGWPSGTRSAYQTRKSNATRHIPSYTVKNPLSSENGSRHQLLSE